jgi:hypothetical protein
MEKEEEEKKSEDVVVRKRHTLQKDYRGREPRGDDNKDSDNDGDKKE